MTDSGPHEDLNSPARDAADSDPLFAIDEEPESNAYGATEPRTGMERFLLPRRGMSTPPSTPDGGEDRDDGDESDDLGAERHSTLDTDGVPRSPRDRAIRRLLTHGVPALVLLAVIAWSARELREMSVGPRTNRPAGHIEERTPPPTDVIVRPAPVAEPEIETELRGKDVKLGDSFVDRVLTDTTERLSLRMLLKQNVVSVVNLWATWCKPCMKELPEFRQLFADNQATWGESVRFVPVLVEESKDPVWISQHYAAEMPPTNTFLVDRAIEGIKSALVDAEFLDPKTELPVTLLVDCRQQVRWHILGALDKASFAQLATEVEAIRGELGTKYCNPPKRRSIPRISTSGRPAALSSSEPAARPEGHTKSTSTLSPKRPPASCGNRKCELGEDCRCRDCACKSSSPCTMNSNADYFCKDEELME